jgi:hypothetical protein
MPPKTRTNDLFFCAPLALVTDTETGINPTKFGANPG